MPTFPHRTTEALVFLDETGTPDYLPPAKLAAYHRTVAAGQKPTYPILFGLAGVLFKRDDYFNGFDADFKSLKVAHLGADIPMHEYDLRTRKKPPFDALKDPLKWQAFRKDIAAVFQAHHFSIVVVAIEKPAMQDTYLPPAEPFPPYHYSLENIVERTAMESKNFGYTWRIVAEDREKGLNADLSAEMLRLQWNGCGKGIASPRSNVDAMEVRRKFHPEIVFRQKKLNDSGLQVADLAVGPIVRNIFGLDLNEKRSLRDIVIGKLCRAKDGKVRGFGIKCFPDFPLACTL